MKNCDEYDQAAATLQDHPSPDSVEEIGGLTRAQALKLVRLEARLSRHQVLLFRRLTRMVIAQKAESAYVFAVYHFLTFEKETFSESYVSSTSIDRSNRREH